MKSLGAAVRERRLALDLSQEDLARRSDVASSYISKLERGLVPRPGAALLERVIGALGFSNWQSLLAWARKGIDAPPVPTVPVPVDPSTVPTVYGPDGRPLKPLDIGGGVIGYVPQEIDPAGIPESALDSFRQAMRDVVRETMREVVREELREVGGEVVRQEIRRAWLGHGEDGPKQAPGP